MARLLFLQNIWYETLAAPMLAAYVARDGHRTEMLVEANAARIVRHIVRTRPDVVAFSATTGVHRWALATARAIKAAVDIPIILGGPHPTFYPDVIRHAEIDVAVAGEGEEALAAILGRIDRREPITGIANTIVRRDDGSIERNPLAPLAADLDDFPFPDRSIFEDRYRFFRTDPTRHLAAGRGCIYRCTYCFNRRMTELYEGKGKYLRFRSPYNVIEEIRLLRVNPRVKLLYFVDDNLLLDKSWFTEFLDRYRAEVALPFIINTMPQFVTDERVVASLASAGCRSLNFGLEAGNEAYRKQMLNRTMSNETIIAAARMLRRHGIRYTANSILGFPDETLEMAFETIELNTKVDPDFARVHVYNPYPGTELGDYCIARGLIDADYNVDNFENTYYKNSLLKQPGIHEIANLQKFYAVAINYPRLRPLIRALIKLPPNRAFEALYVLSTGLQYSTTVAASLPRTVLMGLKNLRFFLG